MLPQQQVTAVLPQQQEVQVGLEASVLGVGSGGVGPSRPLPGLWSPTPLDQSHPQQEGLGCPRLSVLRWVSLWSKLLTAGVPAFRVMEPSLGPRQLPCPWLNRRLRPSLRWRRRMSLTLWLLGYRQRLSKRRPVMVL